MVRVLLWLTVSFPTELPKTKEEFEERLIFKSFFLKSMNAFAPIFYVAFFKGRCVCVSFTESFFTHFSPASVFIPYHMTWSSLHTGLLGDPAIMFMSLETIAWRRYVNLYTLVLLNMCMYMYSKCGFFFSNSVLHQAASSSCASSSA